MIVTILVDQVKKSGRLSVTKLAHVTITSHLFGSNRFLQQNSNIDN